jgi:diaminohydroxyphosphoribosylaminopyrimidine deaminase/5-amino-6-(5-phosphoribosylamino)uracil reductase
LINAGIMRVVAPIEDPNPLVAGRGFDQLRKNGVEIVIGALADEARRLNEKFFVWHEKRRPFVHLKLAMSLDGRISLSNSVSTAISNPEAIRRVHEIWHEYDAILVGGNTALVDDPMLTDRSGRQRRRPLNRIILDNRIQLPIDSRLVSTAREIPTFLFSAGDDTSKRQKLIDAGLEVPEIDARRLSDVLQHLRDRQIQSVLVEGGTEVAGAFLDARLVDKITLMVAPLIIGGKDASVAVGGAGVKTIAAAPRMRDLVISNFGSDLEITGYPTYPE